MGRRKRASRALLSCHVSVLMVECGGIHNRRISFYLKYQTLSALPLLNFHGVWDTHYAGLAQHDLIDALFRKGNGGMADTAEQVANWFLAHNAYQSKDDEYIDPITHLKLQKLLYYAQGTHLAISGVPLFDENILAWEHGSVVREVYDKYHEKGRTPLEPVVI